MYNWASDLRAIKFLVVIGLLWVSSCVTRGEGDQIQADLQRLLEDVNRLNQAQKEINNGFDKNVKRLADIQESNALSGVEKAQMEEELSALRGRIEVLEHDLTEFKDKGSAAIPSNKYAENEAEHYEAAKKLYEDGKYEEAVEAFDAYLHRTDVDKTRMPAAYFWEGDAYYQNAQRANDGPAKKELFKKAVLSFQKLLTEFPKASQADQTLYKIGLCMEAMGYHEDAVRFFKEVVAKYPKSASAHQAERRLKNLKPQAKAPAKKEP